MGGGGRVDLQLNQLLMGALVVDVADAATRQLVWRGMAVADVDVHATPEKRDASVTKAVTKILEELPAGTGSQVIRCAAWRLATRCRSNRRSARRHGSLLGRVVLIRHAETAWTVSGQCTGRTDVPLTDSGRHAARLLAVPAAGANFARVVTSPLRRARETCALAGLDGAGRSGRRPRGMGLRRLLGSDAERDCGPGAPAGCCSVTAAREGRVPARWPRGGGTASIARVRAMNGDVALVGHGHVFQGPHGAMARASGSRRGPVPARPGDRSASSATTAECLSSSAGTRGRFVSVRARIRRTPPADDRTESAEPALTQAARLDNTREATTSASASPAEPSPTRRIAFLSLSLERVTPAPDRVSQPASNEGFLSNT